MRKKLLLSISCLCLFTLMSWVGVARAQNIYAGLGVAFNKFDLGSGNEIGTGGRFYEEEVTTIPLILGIMTDLGIPVAFEISRQSGEGAKKFKTGKVVLGADEEIETLVKYTLTSLEVQPHLTLTENTNAFLIAGRAKLDASFDVKRSLRTVTSSATVTTSMSASASRSTAGFYFGGGVQFKAGESWLLRLALRKMSFDPFEEEDPNAEKEEVKNTNIGVNALYKF